MNVNPFTTGFLLSAIAYGMTCLVLAFWVSSHARGGTAYALMCLAPILMSSPFQEAARLATPDACALLFLLSGTLLLVQRESSILAMLLLGLSPLIRPDAVIFVDCLAIVWCFQQRRMGYFGVTLVALASLSYGISNSCGGYSWSTLLKHTFLGRLYIDSRMTEGITVSEYFSVLSKGFLGNFNYHPSYLPWAALAGLVACRFLNKNDEDKKIKWLLHVSWLYVPVHFVLFPTLDNRFFLITMSVSVVALLVVMDKRLSTISPKI